jgi:A1 cistron-splicing factor AAR2
LPLQKLSLQTTSSDFYFYFQLGVPLGTEFGIDLRSFSVADRFRGMKMIPDGPHYVWSACKSPYGDSAPRTGFIYHFKRGEILIREWDNEKEELRLRIKGNPEEEKQRIKENLRDLDRYLAPYDYTCLSSWKSLTDQISEATIERLAPELGMIRTSVELLSCPDAERPRGGESSISPRSMKIKSAIDEEALLPNLKSIPGTQPQFTKLPDRLSSTPAEISQSYMDSIRLVDQLIETREKAILEEIQFAFVLFLCGHSMDALSHWRNILQILANSETATGKYKTFYRIYLRIIQHQLPELPFELMEPVPSNTVYQDVKKLVINCTVCGMKDASDRLISHLSSSIAWNFDNLFEEDPDDLPVIVDLDK